ncbi:ATP-binding protein [Geoglobus sp.]
MRLQTKLVTVIVLSFLVVLSLSVTYVTYSVMSISDNIEEMVVRMESGSILNYVNDQVNELRGRCGVFITSNNLHDLSSLERALSNPSTLDALGVSFAVLLNNSSMLFVPGYIASEGNTSVEFREDIETMLESRSGVILLDKPAVFTVVNLSDGRAVFVRYFDRDLLNSLAKHEDVDVRVSSRYVDSIEYELEDGLLVVYVPLIDVKGDVALVFEYTLYPYWRDLSGFGIVSTIVFVSATTVAVGVAVLITLSRDVRRIEKISEFMKRITERRNFGERLEVEGNDEVSSLAGNINRMLDEIERFQKNLSNANENLRLLNSLLRHDLLNRLTRIMGYAEMGIEGENPQYYKHIVEAVQDSVRLIERVRNLEVAFAEFRPVRINLRKVIEDVMKEYAISYEIRGDGDVLADDGLHSVIDNLVQNAIKHGKTTRIDFEIADAGNAVELRVIDYGTGIPDDVKERIFEEGFSTADSLGLGLYISKKIVERYGGSIEVQDNQRGGAVFVIRIPKA